MKKRYFTNDDWRYKNEAYGRQYATLYYNIERELDKALDDGERDPYMLDYLKKRNPLFTYREEPEPTNIYGSSVPSNYAHSTTYMAMSGATLTGSSPISRRYVYQYDGKSVEWIFNNGERQNLADDVHRVGERPEGLFLSDVKSIYIVPDDPGTDDNRVRIYVYLHTTFTTESNKGLRRTYFQGFNEASTFQMEDYNVVPPMAYFRRTLYWNPDIITDDEGKAKVEFFNNSSCKEMYISVEGMTPDGKVLVNQ